jgi:hypothetical protein
VINGDLDGLTIAVQEGSGVAQVGTLQEAPARHRPQIDHSARRTLILELLAEQKGIWRAKGTQQDKGREGKRPYLEQLLVCLDAGLH